MEPEPEAVGALISNISNSPEVPIMIELTSEEALSTSPKLIELAAPSSVPFALTPFWVLELALARSDIVVASIASAI